MLVKEIMTTDIVTCDVGASLQAAAKQMLTNNIGSVIVTRDGDPFGILTETDALHAGAVTDRPFQEIPAKKVATHPLVTATRDETVRTAINRMQNEDIKKLPVVVDLDIIGIITQTDISAHYSSFIHEAHELERKPGSWSGTDRIEDEEE